MGTTARNTWKTYATVAVIILVTGVAVVALIQAYPVYLERNQTCIIPPAGSVGAVVCNGKTLTEPAYISSACLTGGPCLTLSYANALRLSFDTDIAVTVDLEYKANGTLAMNLTCACGANFEATQSSLTARYPVGSGSYDLVLTNHNSEAVEVNWTVYLSRWSGPHHGFLSKYFGLGSA